MISKYEHFTASYFLTRSLFLGIGFSLITGIAKQDSILAFFIGTLIGLFFIFFINQIQKYKGKKSLHDVLKEMKFLGILLRIVFLIFGICLFAESLTFFQLFVSSFLLTKTPLFFISLPLILLILKVCKSGKQSVFRLSGCLFPISILLTITSLCFLLGYSKFETILPLMVTKSPSFLKAIFHYIVLSVGPSILLLMTEENNTHTPLSYLLGSFTLVFKMYLIIAIVGPMLASIFRFPEYIILKEIKLLDFIEKVENIVALSWVFDYFIYMAMSAYFIKELLPKKGNEIWHFLVCIGIYILAFMVIGKNYTFIIFIYYYLSILIFFTFLITIPPIFIHVFKKRKASV